MIVRVVIASGLSPRRSAPYERIQVQFSLRMSLAMDRDVDVLEAEDLGGFGHELGR